jgi:hypothetical protein
MIDLKGPHQVSLFLPSDLVVANSRNISKAMSLFETEELLPSNYDEFNEFGQTPRFKLADRHGAWNINFNHARIDIFQSKGHTHPSDFAEQAHTFLERIQSEFNLTGIRASLVIPQLTKPFDSELLDKLFPRLFVPTGFYQNKTPFEWDQRVAVKHHSQINGHDETLNVIAEYRRVSAVNTQDGSTTDRLEIKTDINTQPESKELRVTVEFLDDFLQQALELHEELFNDIGSMLHE